MTGTMDRQGPFHWKVFAIYALAGPPVGAWLLLTILLIPEMMSAQNPIEALGLYLGMVFFSLLFTYFTGGLQAIATGLIAGFVAAFGDGRVGWWTALLAPAVVGAITYLILASMGSKDPGFALTLGVTGIAASLTLKLLFNRTFSTPQISHP